MSANCNGGILDIPQALYGQNGISAYVYIAFANTVTPGTPDVVTGFSYEFPTPTSEWMAIITSTVPINNPVAVDFDNYWVKIKGAAGVGSAGVGIEVNNSVITGSPFTILNFLAAGASNLTGITGTNAGGGQVDLTFVTAGLNKRYYANILTEISNQTLIPGASYWIVDVGDGENPVGGIADCSPAYYGQTYPSAGFDNYPHNAGIILRAISRTQFDPNGIYLARVLNRINVSVVFVPNGSYPNGDYVENYNEAFRLTSPAGTYTTDPAGDPTNWAFVPKDNNTYYNLEVQGCIYDVNANIIVARWDKYNNYLANVNSLIPSNNELIKKAFRWGTPSYAGNKINIFDNVPKSTTFRKPDYYAAGGNTISLVNYSAIGEFKDNYIDQGGTYHTNYEFTRFFNVNLSLSIFTGNIINSSVISNLDESVFGFTAITKNTIKDSVINKASFQQFSDNTIINNTVLGDIFYRNIAPATTSTSANALLFKTRVAIDLTSTQGICNDAILNGLGSRVYQTVAGNGTSTASSAANIVTVTLNGANNTHYSAAGDIVFFISGPPELVNTFAPILTTPSTTSFTVAGTIAPYTGAITMLIFHEAIGTSFQYFIGNTIENTVIRGVNKSLSSASYFNKNDIKYTIIDNYVAHTNNVVNEPWNYDSSCNPGSIEIGSSTGTNGFSNNTIEYSLFYANRIRDFYQNDISGAFFYRNGDDVSGSTGFLGVMRNNKCIGIKAVGVDGSNLVPWGTSVSQINSSASIYFSDNDFAATSQFINTVITEFNAVISCVLNTSSVIDSWTLKGNFGGSVIIALFTSYTGLQTVALNASTTVYGITLEGRNPKLTGVRFGANSYKEINYTVNPRTFSRNLLRDLEIAPSGYGSDALVPSLFGDNMNMIRNITAVTGAATPTAIGTITYQTTTFTLTVQTQMPHMINATGGVYQVGVEGMTVNTVAANDAALPANNSPNGNYRTWSSGSALLVTATIASIVDEYTFTCTATLTSTGRYLLHSTNAVVDGQGLASPGAGIIGPYNDLGRDYIEFPYWFKDRKNALNTTNCSPLNSVISPDYSELTTRIALGLTDTTVPIGPALPSGTRNYYVFYNYTAATTLLYNSGTFTLTLPKYFELMGGTVIFGSHVSATYQISFIANMPEGLPIRFVTTLGCPVQFNLVATGALASNRIIQDSAATSYTIRTYTFGSQHAYDEIVLMKQNGVIRILSKIIHV